MKLSLLLSLFSVALTTAYDPKACNNSPSLCSRTYDDVVYLGAHNSPSIRDASTEFNVGGVQYFNVTVQLSAGVRLVTAQLQLKDGQPRLCHGSCSFIDSGPLDNYLKEIKAWLDKNPSEVITITIINEASATPAQIASSFESANLLSELFIPDGTGWPTLQSMIDAKTRIVCYFSSGANTATHPYFLPEFDYVFETAYENTQLVDFTKCSPDRPSDTTSEQALARGLLPWANRYLYTENSIVQLPDVNKIKDTNNPDTLFESLTQCGDSWGGLPTYVLVDFFNEGPAIGAIDKANGIRNPVNRIDPPETPTRETETEKDNDNDPSNGGGVDERKRLAEKALKGEKVGKADWILVAGGWGKMIAL